VEGEKKAIRLLPVIAAAAMLAGCNMYQLNYKPYSYEYTGAAPVPFTGAPQVVYASDDDAEGLFRSMYADGYGVVGFSWVESENENPPGAPEVAQKVHASLVTLSENSHVETGTYEESRPVGETVTTTHGRTSDGQRYTERTRSVTKEIVEVPYQVTKYDIDAYFFQPLTRTGMGILVRPATEAEAKKAKLTYCLAVAAVRKESPAAKASIAVDDLILSMDGKAVNDLTQARLAIAMASGHTVNMVLFHSGRKVTKRVTVPTVW
jgi:hypothetical protein